MIELIIFYVVSVVLAWITTRAYHIKYNIEPDGTDVILIFIPVANLFCIVIQTLHILIKYAENIDVNNFFKIKKMK